MPGAAIHPAAINPGQGAPFASGIFRSGDRGLVRPGPACIAPMIGWCRALAVSDLCRCPAGPQGARHGTAAGLLIQGAAFGLGPLALRHGTNIGIPVIIIAQQAVLVALPVPEKTETMAIHQQAWPIVAVACLSAMNSIPCDARLQGGDGTRVSALIYLAPPLTRVGLALLAARVHLVGRQDIQAA